jgi:hypothetical protein
MQAVIDNANVKTVDGIRTDVVSEDNQFKYVQYILVKGTPIALTKEVGSPISFGGVAEGSDIKQIGAFSAAGLGIFPVYWITGGVGLIYHPEECFKPTLINGSNQDEFNLLVKEKTNVANRRALEFQVRLDSLNL